MTHLAWTMEVRNTDSSEVSVSSLDLFSETLLLLISGRPPCLPHPCLTEYFRMSVSKSSLSVTLSQSLTKYEGNGHHRRPGGIERSSCRMLDCHGNHCHRQKGKLRPPCTSCPGARIGFSTALPSQDLIRKCLQAAASSSTLPTISQA